MAGPTTKNKISVSLTDEAAAAVEELTAKTGLGVSEVVRRALALERFFEKEIGAGSDLLIRKPNGDVEKVQFIFG